MDVREVKEQVREVRDQAARFLSRSPAVIRKPLEADDQEDEEQLLDGGVAGGKHDEELAEIEALKNIDRGEGTENSFRSKMKKKMTSAIGKLSTVTGSDGKRDQLSVGDKSFDGPAAKKGMNSPDGDSVKKSPLMTRLKVTKISDSSDPKSFSGRASLNNSVEDLDDLDTDSEQDKTSGTDDAERPSPEGDDVTDLGPGQVCPRQGVEAPSNGDLKLGIIMTKGQLEVHLMCARGLPAGANGQAPDTYVKTYLTDSTKKKNQKKKTKIVKSSCDPMYRQKTKYSACNVYKRQILASVWERSAVFDKNLCVGQVVVDLEDFDLTTLTTGWYRLYRHVQAGDDSESDSMNAY